VLAPLISYTTKSIGVNCSFVVVWLAELYMHGESTFQILEQGKMKSVSVTRTEYCLTDDAIKEFKDIHDGWELDVCEKNPHDPLLGGKYGL